MNTLLLVGLALVCAQILQTQYTSAQGTTVIFRLAFVGVGAPFSPNSTVQPFLRNGQTGQVVTLLTQPQGGVNSVGPYQFASLNDVNGVNTPPSVEVCFNSSAFGERCSSQVATLEPFGFGGQFSPITRFTVTLQQTFSTTPATCSGTGQQCFNAGTTTSTFNVFVSEEVLTDRDCAAGPVFVRGTNPNCPLQIIRNNNPANFSILPATPTGFTEQVSLVFTNGLTPTPLDASIQVPVAFSLPRSGITYFVAQPANTQAGPLNGARRSWEILVNDAAGDVTVSSQQTFFVAIVNVAHRESPFLGSFSVDQTITVGIQDVADNSVITATGDNDATNDNVWHFQTLQRGFATGSSGVGFIELPFFANSHLQILVIPGTQTFFNASAAATFQRVDLTNIAANSYQLVTVSGSLTGTGFTVRQFDVTPNVNDVPNTVEQEFINLVQPTGSLGNTNNAVTQLSSYDLTLSSQNGTSFACDRVLSFSSVGDSQTVLTDASGGSDVLSVVPSGAACCGATSLGSVPLSRNSFVPNTCGKRVTLIIGRPYQVTIPSCTTNLAPNGGTCTFNNNTAPVFGIGDLSFTGNSFFETANGVNTLQTITFDIQSCDCVQTAPVVTTCSASACDVLNAISGSSVAGTVSGLAGSLNTVISKLTHINATLFNVKNLDVSIKDLVKKRC